MKKLFILIAAIVFASTVSSANATGVCEPTSFTATVYSIPVGEGTTLHWDSQNCDSASIVPAFYPGDRPPYGSVSTGAIDRTTEFTLTVYDADGNIGGQRFLTIFVTGSQGGGGDECEIDEFNADDTSIEEGDSTRLNWETTGCDYVNITSDDRDFNNQNEDGSVSVSPNETTTYTLKAYPGGDTATVRINVDDSNDEVCQIDSFSANPTSINRGSSSTLRWTTSGAVDHVTISSLSGNRNEDGSVSVSPFSNTTYTLRAYCENGDTETDTVTVRVNAAEEAPQAITTAATVLGNTQARLNGIAIANTTNDTTTAWFEWGSSSSLGNRTQNQTVNLNDSSYYYSAPISGLISGGTYYYRAVVQNTNGTAYGDIVSFRTNRTVVTTTPPPRVIVRPQVQNVVVAQSAPSLLELRVETNYDRMCINGNIDYTITYRNISSQKLDNTVLQFTHPKEITYLSSSRGDYEVVDRTLTIDLGTVSPGEQGTITVHARVNDSAVRGNLTVATATVVYTNSLNNAQEDAIAYSLITVSDDCPNVLGASAFGFGSFLPSTCLGWLLLILIILALIALSRHLYRKDRTV